MTREGRKGGLIGEKHAEKTYVWVYAPVKKHWTVWPGKKEVGLRKRGFPAGEKRET